MATLTVNEILMDTLDAFKTVVPMLNSFSLDFKSQTAVKGDTITAHISGLPAVADVHATTGFANGAVEAETLITDVPVVLDQLKHVPIKVDWITQLSSKKPLYVEAVRNYAYVLGKSVVDAAMAKILAANVTNSKTKAAADCDFSTLEEIRTQLNTQKAAPRGRFGFINPTVAGYLQQDTTINNSQTYGQLNGGDGYRTFRNVCGFENIFEYPDVPTGENLLGFFGDRRLVTVAARRPDFGGAAEALGVPQVMKFYPISDPETGLELLGVAWQSAGTGDVYVSACILYGVSVGAQGGAANSITDPAGIRLKSA